MTAAVATPQVAPALRDLGHSLNGFRQDLECLFDARCRYSVAVQRLQARCGRRITGEARSPVGQAPSRISPCMSAVSAQTPANLILTQHAPLPSPTSLSGGSLGIGIGISGLSQRIGAESESFRGKRDVDTLGGAGKLRELIADFTVSCDLDVVPQISAEEIQDVWVDEISDRVARVSALYVCNGAMTDCRQFRLLRHEAGSWKVDSVLELDADDDECEMSLAGADSFSAAARVSRGPRPVRRSHPVSVIQEETEEDSRPSTVHSTPVKNSQGKGSPSKGSPFQGSPERSSPARSSPERGDAHVGSPLQGISQASCLDGEATPPSRRRAPPPLDDILEAPPSIAASSVIEEGNAAADGDPESLVEAIQHGLNVVTPEKTPRAVFNGFAVSSPGAHAAIPHDQFLSLVAMYGGRSPASASVQNQANDAGEALFKELALQSGGASGSVPFLGVPYDLFCAELCPERAPDAVRRIVEKREQLLIQIQEGARRNPEALKELLAEALRAPISEELFGAAVLRLLGCPTRTSGEESYNLDLMAPKALWCSLVRGRKGHDRTLSASEFSRLLKQSVGHSSDGDREAGVQPAVPLPPSSEEIPVHAAKRVLLLSRELRSAMRSAGRPGFPRMPAEFAGSDLLDESGFNAAVHKLLSGDGRILPDALCMKVLWQSIVAGRSDTRIAPKDLLACLCAQASELGRSGSLEFSDDDDDNVDASLDLSMSHSACGAEDLVDHITPFASPAVSAMSGSQSGRIAGGVQGSLTAAAESSGSSRISVLENELKAIHERVQTVQSTASMATEFDAAEAMPLSVDDSKLPSSSASTSPARRLSRKERLVLAVEENPQCGSAWAALGGELRERETIIVCGEELTMKGLFLRAIEVDPEFASAYSDLGSVLSLESASLSNGGTSTVTLQGRQLGEKELYIRALELDPGLAVTWSNLADTISHAESVSIRGKDYDMEEMRAMVEQLESQ